MPSSQLEPEEAPSDISGGSTGSLRSRVAKLGMDYMDSFPGPSNAASQTMIQGKIEQCVRGTMTDEGQLLRLLRMLDFRNGQMKQADMLIKQASLKFPQGKRCSEWDFDTFAGFANPRGITQQTYYEVVNMVLEGREIFAEPTFDQGPGWPKPVRYLVAALLASDLSREEIKAKIDEMAHCTFSPIQADLGTQANGEHSNEASPRGTAS
ncbi:hypothetical protein W97_07983 [Coniosporium apollinis CBS 100218]|uniref:Uncharacterized protein n=1 Tax=Coniosporium apollinis (strain CBS 100218) TaxID=1168221 RepID=R7Z3F6_CONA1|nr:uncharacterized protein W97_07983 [Coniosporium apollinis CBS 100218]EON68725.1 hypothetical protein W97_07983 [Coniosporium apollinis CBS 100218]